LLPVISELVSPVESIAPIARDGHIGVAVLRKPPASGPFPAVILIHGGLVSRPPEFLRQYALTAPPPSVFLAAGYVVGVITYRSRDDDPQSRVSLEDSLAAIDHVGRLPYVDSQSIGVYGCSGGGDLALEIAAATAKVRALVLEEPASIIFAGVLSTRFPKAGPRYTPADARPIGDRPKDYYTSELQTRTRAKINRITSPLLIIQGDQDPTLTPFNNQILIPELRDAGRNLEVKSYPGEPHCFAFGGRSARPVNVITALEHAELFIRRHVNTKPKPVDSNLVTHVTIGRPK
jgi:dipeptidyl aminopeptidase/acylaminoacyl peptidase